MSAVQSAKVFIQQQFKALSKDHDNGFSVGLVDDDIFRWRVLFAGPSGTLYEGGFFTCILTFPTDFPNSPPEMKFVNEMWHPNIFPDGKVCISILHPPGTDVFNEQESANERWRPVLGVEQILVSVISMLVDPNVDSPANVDAAVQMKNNLGEYKKKVRRLTRLSAEN